MFMPTELLKIEVSDLVASGSVLASKNKEFTHDVGIDSSSNNQHYLTRAEPNGNAKLFINFLFQSTKSATRALLHISIHS